MLRPAQHERKSIGLLNAATFTLSSVEAEPRVFNNRVNSRPELETTKMEASYVEDRRSNSRPL